jgi:hypothetical protein
MLGERIKLYTFFDKDWNIWRRFYSLAESVSLEIEMEMKRLGHPKQSIAAAALQTFRNHCSQPLSFAFVPETAMPCYLIMSRKSGCLDDREYILSNPSIGEPHLFQRWNDIIYVILGIGTTTLSNAEDEFI